MPDSGLHCCLRDARRLIIRGIMLSTLKTLALALLLIPALAGPAEVRAQQPVEGIAAVVNDEVISLSDLVARMRLALLSSGLQPPDETQQRLLPQLLPGHIDQRLQSPNSEERRVGKEVAGRDRSRWGRDN